MYYCIGRTGNYCLMIDLDTWTWSFKHLKEAAQFIKDKRILRNDYEKNGSLCQCIAKVGNYPPASKVNTSYRAREWARGKGFAYCLVDKNHWSPLYVRPFDIFLTDCTDYPDITPYIVLYGDEYVYNKITEEIISLQMVRDMNNFGSQIKFE